MGEGMPGRGHGEPRAQHLALATQHPLDGRHFARRRRDGHGSRGERKFELAGAVAVQRALVDLDDPGRLGEHQLGMLGADPTEVSNLGVQRSAV